MDDQIIKILKEIWLDNPDVTLQEIIFWIKNDLIETSLTEKQIKKLG